MSEAFFTNKYFDLTNPDKRKELIELAQRGEVMTEDQAIQKRCCGPENCGNLDSDGVRWCNGSVCMAWVPTWAMNDAIKEYAPSKTIGRCGLVWESTYG